MNADNRGPDSRSGRGGGGTGPTRVGKYRIDHVIGRGAIGIVYKGYDEQIDRPLAIKTLRPEILKDVDENDEFLKRFAAEARSAGRRIAKAWSAGRRIAEARSASCRGWSTAPWPDALDPTDAGRPPPANAPRPQDAV